MADFDNEVQTGKRFTFGKNWSEFLATLNDERISAAEQSLREMLGVSDLTGKRFLDIGSGSGLFSLVARRLGAEVVSFDYDPQSVACAETLKTRYFRGDSKWRIERGSALDIGYVRSLGKFDIVYSWGVLHHTGAMWQALANASEPVKAGGQLFIAIYNDQGGLSRFWWRVKKTYCAGPVRKAGVMAVFVPYFAARAVAKSAVTGTNAWTAYKRKYRGMSLWHDWIDWLGGFPFEVASVDAIKNFYEERGFMLQKVKTTASMGNNEFVFEKS